MDNDNKTFVKKKIKTNKNLLELSILNTRILVPCLRRIFEVISFMWKLCKKTIKEPVF
jgi:hypothetical protein